MIYIYIFLHVCVLVGSFMAGDQGEMGQIKDLNFQLRKAQDMSTELSKSLDIRLEELGAEKEKVAALNKSVKSLEAKAKENEAQHEEDAKKVKELAAEKEKVSESLHTLQNQ